MDIQQLMTIAAERKASDIHITVGSPTMLRVNGRLEQATDHVLSEDDTVHMAKQILDNNLYEQFLAQGDFDFAYDLPNVSRFRVNLFHQKGSVGIVCRLVAAEPPKLEDLDMPDIVRKFAHQSQGLLLVTGPTGSGKSTTLAALIRYMNEHMSRHIITLEDPIEYIHKHNKCLINQREVSHDTSTFTSGLRASLRQDPDVILVGEMRDLETIRIAITAAETGHLVLATLHTSTASQTIDRIIDVFPGDEQQQIRTQLASVLVGIVCQRLFPHADQNGRVAVMEILVNLSGVANLIRSDKIHQIKTMIETGRQSGMQTMEQAVQQLVQQRKVTAEVAQALLPNWNRQ